MVNRFGKTPLAGLPTIEPGSHQEKVYNEMFKAIELLGRKLERSESERERLARRLSLIESAATVDDATGRLYLPTVVGATNANTPVQTHVPKWAVTTSAASIMVALASLYFALYSGPSLTPQQMAALDAMVATRVATLDEKKWTTIDTPSEEESLAATEPTEPPGGITYTMEAAPASDTLTQSEMLVEAEKLAEIEPAVGTPATTAADISKTVEEEKNIGPQNVLIPGEDLAAERPLNDTPAEPKTEKLSVAQREERTANMNRRETEKQAGSAALFSRIAPDQSLPPDLALLEKRAAEDVPEAQHDLATLYASGRNVPQDFKRAVYWFSRAADGGVANAHYNLGVMFQQGLGVRKDVKKALGWYKSASELGHPEAMYNLGIAYIEGVGTKRDIEKGASYFRRAANAGVAQAAYNLGVLYESNFLGEIDLPKALEWYKTAQNEGHAEARDAIGRVEQQIGEMTAQARKAANTEPAAGN